MGAVYGYFRIAFFTNDGSADAEAAKRAYDWCKANYDWFKGEKEDGSDAPFLLEENGFVPNAAVASEVDDGAFDLKRVSVPSDVDWLGEPCKQTKAARLVASLYEDGSDFSYDSNSYVEKVWIDGELKGWNSLDQFDTSRSPCFQQDSSLLLYYDNEYSLSYNQVRAVFKNTKTGEEFLAGQLESDYDEYGCVDDSEPMLCFLDTRVSPDDKEACVKALIEYLKEGAGVSAPISESDWTFERLDSQRSFFDIYGTNPPLKDYRWVEEFYDDE